MQGFRGLPKAQGLYDPQHEHDACGTGFVVNIKGERSHEIVRKALQVLDNLTHRGACGCDPLTGDGAGILMQIPHEFMLREAVKLGFALPAAGEYSVGVVFMPRDVEKRAKCEELFERVIREEGQKFLGWRTVPIDATQCGVIAREGMPEIRQIFIGRGDGVADQEIFERKLYVIRKRVTNLLAERGRRAERAGESASCVQNKVARLDLSEGELFYVCSLSSSTIVYKGQLISHQIPRFYPDLTRSGSDDRARDGPSAVLH